MTLLFIICTLIVGLIILFGCAATVYWKVESREGFQALAIIAILFLISYIVMTGMVHIARLYWKLPILPWEFAG